MQDFPLEVVSYFVQIIDNPKTLGNLLLSNSIFIISLSKKELQNIKKKFTFTIQNDKERYTLILPQWKRHGKYVQFFSDGSLYKKCMYKNGELHGEYKRMWRNGKINFLGRYKNGLLDGKCTTYFHTGEILRVIEYKNGIKNGIFNEYTSNGILRKRQHYVDGKLLGIY